MLSCSALLLASLSGALAAQGAIERRAEPAGPPSSEGPLDNDVFVAVSEPAEVALREGDAALARSRAARGQAAEASRLLDEACEHWHEALVVGGPGASHWFDARPEATRRLGEGVHAAVWRRLTALEEAERARWSQRFREASTRALTAPGEAREQREAALAEVVRLYPLSEGAARAALCLADAALESGRVEAARAWLTRGEFEAAPAGAEVGRALAARRGVLPPLAEPADELWLRASSFEPAGSLAFEPERDRTPPTRWIGPGAVFLGPHEVAIQTARDVLIVSLVAGDAPAVLARLHPLDYLAPDLAEQTGGARPHGGALPYTPELALDAPREPPGWPLLPAAQGGQLVLVVGRLSVEGTNALLVLDVAPTTAHQGLGLEVARSAPAARLAWAIVGSERLTRAGATPVPELEELGEFEFQPGPVLCADRVLVQVREYSDQTRAHLLAFDRLDGTLAWKRLLASGADLVPTDRFAAQTKRLSAQPLIALDVEGAARVFAGTHLGLGVLVDGLLGEPLWSLKNRRRDAHESGWSGARPVLTLASDPLAGLLWAPADSDRCYALVPRPLRSAPEGKSNADELAAVLLGPPVALQDAEGLLGGDGERLLVLEGSGAERVSERRAGRDRVDALALRPDEHFRGAGRASPSRAWVSTDHALYLFDRGRELYLLDSRSLTPTGVAPPGGEVYGRGDHVLVLGSGALWSFRAR